MDKLDKSVDTSIYRKRAFVEKEEDIRIIDGFPVFRIVEFNVYGACNRSCSFCPVSDPSFYMNKYEGISNELFTKIMMDLDEIQYNGTLLISAFSEPFLNKDLPELVRTGKSILPDARIEINSNGDIFKKRIDKLKDLFKAGLDAIIVSVYDGPTAYDEFLKMRATLNLSESQFVIRRRYFDGEKGDWGIIFSNRAGLIDTNKFQEETEDGTETLPLKRHCFYPFYQTLIDYNGDMILCPHDWGKEYIVGNLSEENLWDLWTSDKYQTARKFLSHENRNFKPCHKCNVKGNFIGKTNFETWIQTNEF
jgi:radical SAM protein with 4Fe4S-binding SPASM domain